MMMIAPPRRLCKDHRGQLFHPDQAAQIVARCGQGIQSVSLSRRSVHMCTLHVYIFDQLPLARDRCRVLKLQAEQRWTSPELWFARSSRAGRTYLYMYIVRPVSWTRKQKPNIGPIITVTNGRQRSV